jgi:hypothetical protein
VTSLKEVVDESGDQLWIKARPGIDVVALGTGVFTEDEKIIHTLGIDETHNLIEALKRALVYLEDKSGL